MYRLLILALFLVFKSGFAIAAANPGYEEITVFVRVQGVGGFDMDAIYDYETGRLFLPVQGLFSALRIKYEVSPNLDIISGFLIAEDKTYTIDYSLMAIEFGQRTLSLRQDELLRTDLGLFLHSALYGPVFGLYATFNFRTLSVEIKTDLELPAIREIRLAQMRRNIAQLHGEVEADTLYRRNYNLFRFGMVDWAFNSTQFNRQTHDTRANLRFGAELLGGETNIMLNYWSGLGFDRRNQHYYWRWANNEVNLLRQVRVGRINPQSISSIFNPVAGITATNAPTTFRRAFGSYIISDFTDPGWTVELYVNNVLVDYQVADASGFYRFDVPLVFGTSQIMLKFYGPFGEDRIQHKFKNIPFHFLPRGEVEYSISGGMVLDGDRSRFGRASANVGVNRFLTVGGGFEYLSSIETRPEIPFLSASLRPLRNLVVAVEHAVGVHSKALISYKLPSNLMFEMDYTRFVPGQRAVWFNHLEERRFMLAAPLNIAFLRGFTQLSFRQTVFERLTHNRADWTFSASAGRVNVNLNTFANWIEPRNAILHSNLAIGIRLGKGFTLRTQSQIDINNRSLSILRAEIQKRVSRTGYLSLSAEEHFFANIRSFDLNFRWNLPFAQSNLAARYAGGQFIATQGASGSFAFGSGNGYLHVDNRSKVGQGGLVISPFLDVNHNRIFDDNEPYVSGLRIRVNGGRILRVANDSIVRVVDLEPYTSYLVELEEYGLKQLAWKIEHKKLRVYVDPNQFKKIHIPVLPMGEANGWVYISEDNVLRGLGRILVHFYDKDGNKVARTMTESDGGFTFLGLPPGVYYASVDTEQLNRLDMTSEPERIQFMIQPLSDGDIVDGLEFTIRKRDYDEVPRQQVQPVPVIIETDMLIPSEYFVQIGAFRSERNASALLDRVSRLIKIPVHIAYEDGLFRVRTGGFAAYDEALTISLVLDRQRFANFIKTETIEEVLSGYFLQIGAFRSERNAIALAEKISQTHKFQIHIDFDEGLYKVRIGGFATRNEALKINSILKAAGIDVFILFLPPAH